MGIGDVIKSLRVVAPGSRIFRRGNRKGLDKRYLKAVEKKGLSQRELERELLEVFNTWLKKLAGSGNAEMSVAEHRLQVETLLEKFNELKQRGSAQQLSDAKGWLGGGKVVSKDAGRVTGIQARTDNLLGKSTQELDELRASLDKAEQRALADLRDPTSKLAKAEREKAELAVKERFAARRANLVTDSATLERFFDIWNERMTPNKLKKIFTDFAKQFSSQRTALASNLVELRQIESQMLKGNVSAALRKRAATLAKSVTTKRNPLVDALRSKFKSNRREILKNVFQDAALRKDLDAVDVVLRERKSGSIDLHLRLKTGDGVSARTLRIPLNVDHAETGFAEALDDWVLSGNPARLESILEGGNMQLVTAMENQVMLEGVRINAYGKGMKPLAEAFDFPSVMSSASALNVDAAMSKLGRSLSQEERETVDWVKAQLEHF